VAGASLGTAGNCEHPLAVVDDATGLNLCVVRCKQRRSSRCAGCGERHRRDVARVGRSGWAGWEDVQAFFVTFTAPGQAVLPWDRRYCKHDGSVHCSGTLGCRCEVGALSVWNDSLGMNWTHLMTYIRRALPGTDVQFFKAVEPQSRGALHLHVMFRLSGVEVQEDDFAAVLRSQAQRWAFGPKTDVQPVEMSDGLQVARTAGYCSKYAAKTADADRRFVNPETGEVVRLRARAWSKSGEWGDTMRGIEAGRRLWAASAGVQLAPASGALAQPASAASLDLNSDCYTTGVIGVVVVDDLSEFATV
jgi:hypothetical protein